MNVKRFPRALNRFLGDTISFASILLWAPNLVHALDLDGRADGHAPASLMAEHSHYEGEFMFSYRFMRMNMDGNRDGTNNLSVEEVLEDFPVTPTDMSMESHMLGFMYAPSNDLTLSVVIPYKTLEMDHVTRMGGRFTTRSEGIGDIRVSAILPVVDNKNFAALFSLGLSLPTGDIDATDTTPMGPDSPLPYPMQLGSGTYDFLPGLTMRAEFGELLGAVITGGFQGSAVVRAGENSNDYTLGDAYRVDSWVSLLLTESLSLSSRLAWRIIDNIDGADPALNPEIVSTADPDRRGGDSFEWGIGANTFFRVSEGKSLRFLAEILVPFAQDLDGPQLKAKTSFVGALQLSFT